MFAFHLHKERRIKGPRQVLPPHSESDRGHGRITTDRLWFFSLQFPSLLGGREVVGVGLNYFEIADRAVGTAFLRPSTKMSAQCSSCGRAPPRPGCLLKTQEKAQEARHSKPPVCPEPRSAQLSSDWLKTEQHRTIRFLTHHELTSCSCGHRSAVEPSKIKVYINSLWVVCLFFCFLSYCDHFFYPSPKVGWGGGGLVILYQL